MDEAPDLIGTEFVIFTQEPEYVTVEPPPETKYAMVRRNNGEVAYEEDEVVEEEPEAPVAVKKRPAKKRPATKKPAAKAKAAAKKRPAAKRTARAGTRTGSSKRTPFTRNAASAE